MQHSDLTFNEKHPIILPANHHVTKLIVKYEHAKNLHLGYVGLHYLIRRTFWIINARQVIKAVLRSCLICFKVRPRTPQQLMGNLPKDRVSSQRPFSICGIDFCGPVYVKQGGRSTQLIKAYIAVFVCFIVKAVHLELVSDLTTDSFIAALKRFVARRGKCSCIYSDNARNFVGASKELAALREIFLSAPQNSKLHNELISEGIEWKFTPPYSPHFGGLYESYVKLVKYHLKRVLMNTSLTWEQYATLLTQVEACINSRPITAMSADMNDVTALTPGHFLIGEPLLGVPEPSYLHIPANRLSNWQAVQERTQRFWKRWQQDYLGSLQQRTKWKSKIQNLEIGSLVLVKEPNSPPYQWMLGRVVETHPGTDGLVRVVTLKTARGQILRAIDQICPLNSEI